LPTSANKGSALTAQALALLGNLVQPFAILSRQQDEISAFAGKRQGYRFAEICGRRRKSVLFCL